ncbi:MAG TPA: carboxypeptidase regulatory-like domain-containing protein [Vicinamibacterales bacterium]|nr:carboxypeptidase regulatory-like domain-containing protein [Vicinamibacterales bacterium]
MCTRRTWWYRLAVLLLVCSGAERAAFAQNPTFALEGVVTDAQQAVLPGATVTIQNISTGLTRTVITDDGGRYVVRALPPEGRYKVQVDLQGFASEVREGLTFNAGQRVVLNFTLKLSTVQETITVAGDAPVVQTTSAEVTSTIDRTSFETLPVKERNYFRLLSLDSNVVQSRPGTNAVNVGGGEVWNFGTYVDGTNNHSKWLTLQRAPQLGSGGFALETVKEVQLITNQFSAEFGGHSAGVASMITKSGTNDVAGSAFVMIRPGDWDARPPLSPVKVPYNQQQFGGTAGGPLVRDKIFYFGSYERRRERSQVVVTSPEAFGLVVPTPADEHQGQVKGDFHFSAKNSLGVRYNMVRWRKDNESGGFNLPGSGFIWDNNVDTLHSTFTTVVSDRFLNEVRGQYSEYTDRRAAKCDCVSIQRTAYSTTGGYDQGTWGVLPERTYDISDTASFWRGSHSIKTGASLTYDVTKQLFAPLQNGVYFFSGAPNVAPTPFQYRQAFALRPEARLMYPKAYVIGTFFQDDWRLRQNLTLNLGLRYDVEIIKDIPDWPAGTDKNNLDPRVGFAWDPSGDQKWAIRGGVGGFTQQHPIFTIVKGGVGGRNGLVTISLTPADPLFPAFPNALPGFPPGAVLPPRDIQEISPDLENEHAWAGSLGFQRQLGSRASFSIDANINRGVKHGFLNVNQAAPIPKDVLIAANGATVRTAAQADLTRPILPVPNGFRRIDILTNEGRSWYQGVRFSGDYRTTPLRLRVSYTVSKSEDRLNHWFSPEDSSDPELDRGPTGADTPHNLVTSAIWTIPGSGPIFSGWRLSSVSHSQSGTPYSIRYAGDPTGSGLTSGCNSRGCQASRPGGRNTARGEFIHYIDLSLARTFAVGEDKVEFRADAFNAFNNQNLISDGYINVVGNPNFGKHSGGSAVFPGRQFQFAATYRF